MADKYHESARPQGWGKRRLMKNSSPLYGRGYCDPSGIPLAANSSIPREKRMLRAVAGLIARAKGSSKSKTSTTIAVTDSAASPAPSQLSRANSADTCEETDQGSDEAEENGSSKPRVSFSSEVTVRSYWFPTFQNHRAASLLLTSLLQPISLYVFHCDT